MRNPTNPEVKSKQPPLLFKSFWLRQQGVTKNTGGLSKQQAYNAHDRALGNKEDYSNKNQVISIANQNSI